MMKTICNVLIELGIIALIVFPPIFFGSVMPGHVTNIELAIFAIGCVWVIKTMVKGSVSLSLAPLDAPMLLLLLLGIVNIVVSTYRHNSEREVYLFAFYALLYFLVRQQLRTMRRILGLAFILVLVGSGEAVFGLIRYMQDATTVLGYATPNIGTVNATYFSHNHFAGFLILILPVALGLLVGAPNFEKKFFLLILIGLMGTALTLTLSRGGFLGFGLAAGCFLIFAIIKHARNAFHAGKILILIVIVSALILAGIRVIGFSPIAHRTLLKSFLPDKETVSREIRFSLWRSALPLVKESPFFGSGLGTFEFVFAPHRPPEFGQNQDAYHAHNDYLEWLIEMGISALIVALWGIARFCRAMLRIYFEHDDPVLTSLVLGGLCGCIAIFAHSFVDFNMQIPANAVLFFVIAALTTAAADFAESGRKKIRKSRRNGQTRSREVVSSPEDLATGQFRARWGFLAICAAIMLVFAFHFRQPLASRYYSAGKTLQNLHEPLAALPWYDKAIRVDGDNAEYYEARGKLFFELGQQAPHADKWYRLAIPEFERAIALNANQPAYSYELGWTQAAVNSVPDALRSFEQAIKKDPHTAFYYEQAGAYYLSLNALEPALKHFQDAVRLDPQRMPPMIALCQERGLTYREYQRIVPEEAPYRKRFAELLAQQNLWAESKEQFRAAIAQSGGQDAYYAALLTACEQRKDVPCQQDILRERSQQHPEQLEPALRLAETFEQEQVWGQAESLYRSLLQTHPNSKPILLRLANLYGKMGDVTQAVSTYRQLLAQHPDDAEIYRALARLHQQHNQPDDAIATYQQAIAAGVKLPDLYADLGMLFQQQGAAKQAVDAYRQALKMGEQRFEIYQRLEQMYRAQRKPAEMAFLWEQFALANKNHPENLFLLVQAYQAQGEWLKAVTLVKDVIAAAPSNVSYRTYLADLYEQKGMHAEAKEQYERILRIQPNHEQAKQKLRQRGAKS